MAQEEKNLLLKDLCGRLPYGITIYRITDNSIHRIQYSDITENIDQFSHFLEYSGIDNIKPYLRPMETMADEERMKFSKLLNVRYCEEDWKGHHSTSYCIEIYNGYPDEAGRIKYPSTFSMDAIDWLNSHHFDYRGLIEKGLALEAPEGMYKF